MKILTDDSNNTFVVLSLTELELLLENYPKLVKFVTDFLNSLKS